MIQDARSLNLSNSVAVGVYEALRQWEYPRPVSYTHLAHLRWARAYGGLLNNLY